MIAMNEDRLKEFTDRYMEMTRGAAVMAVMAVADRTGLLKALAGRGPVTLGQAAEIAQLHERLVSEVLATLCAAGFLDYDPQHGTFALSDEGAACIADEGHPNFLGGWSQIVPGLYGVIPMVVKACKEGGGVPYSAFGPEMVEGMARTSGPEVRARLTTEWLPALPRLVARLHAGISVADLGCGCGDATIAMARAYPKSSFVGLDTDATSLERASRAASAAGLGNVTFERIGQSGLPRDIALDFIIAIDVIHDVAHPMEVLAAVRHVLRDGGTFLLIEPDAADRLEDNLHAGGALLYAMSSMHCAPISLAEGGEGVGAAWGPRRAEAYCREAGFSEFRRLPIESSFNAFYEVR